MGKYQLVDCNNCKEDFEIKEVQVRRLDNSVEQSYFVCPHCKREYTSYYTNIEIRKELKNIQSLNTRLVNAKTEANRLRIAERHKICKEKLDGMMKELRQKMEPS